MLKMGVKRGKNTINWGWELRNTQDIVVTLKRQKQNAMPILFSCRNKSD